MCGCNKSLAFIPCLSEMKYISIRSEWKYQVSNVSQFAEVILGVKIMYRPVGESGWNLFASFDELDPPDPEYEADTAIPTDPAVLAADLGKAIPDLYSPFLWRAERQHYPLPAVWRQEVYNVVTYELIASAEYTQEDAPPVGEFSHLRWVISYFDDERGQWVPSSVTAKTEDFWGPLLESLPDGDAIEKALVSGLAFRMLVPILAERLPDTDRWRAEIWDGRKDLLVASTELSSSKINGLLDSAAVHIL